LHAAWGLKGLCGNVGGNIAAVAGIAKRG